MCFLLRLSAPALSFCPRPSLACFDKHRKQTATRVPTAVGRTLFGRGAVAPRPMGTRTTAVGSRAGSVTGALSQPVRGQNKEKRNARCRDTLIVGVAFGRETTNGPKHRSGIGTPKNHRLQATSRRMKNLCRHAQNHVRVQFVFEYRPIGTAKHPAHKNATHQQRLYERGV